ncbi:MAG TPA: hypothetical protein VFX87_07235 [Methylomirabilota bacterium]|nr:hypothetical protein [Methylomirabilota bacterium]
MRQGARRAILIEAATTAWRPRSPSGELRPHPAWSDLDPAGRLEAYEATRAVRRLEAARHPEGMTGTTRAVLARLAGMR